ncbi:Sad1/UNC domain protein [Dactylonectria estremocensis]|uniref:Sad1/UNC domain protein n=1 Tax=Dactylonectria estremocensis TaxID=1079267 RepID=A0A9P9EU65_9HYPO|nr:Sad1/UNC domain protein [Dactylonectria estremocensis]
MAANTCDAITINYITHSLPQSCLTSTWSSSASSSANANDGKTSTIPTSHVTSQASSRVPAPESTPNPSETESESPDGASDGGTKPFMSFEDWKAMMLKETGQDPQDLGTRSANQRGTDDRTPPDMGHAGLGEEDEISLNFDSYLDDNKPGDRRAHATVSSSDSASEHAVLDTVTSDDGRPSVHRSKDAGKTCKERFSYSSFDAGATVLKSGPGAKNTKAILVENKDSYMLLECSTRPKFVIVELSDDILIDTIVLANFEFFSSMIRHFRVSVSDRYPVKTDRWRELGTFEARNSRDIQPFLIENPQIFAKHVQIEFLTHYGNEYYCPLSLLRVHGSALLDSWKDSDPGRDEELHADVEPEVPQIETQSEEAKPRNVQEASDSETTAEASSPVKQSSSCTLTAPSYLFSQTNATCDASPNLARGDSHHHVLNKAVDTEFEQGHHPAQDPAEARGTVKMHVSKTQSSTVEGVATAPPTTASPTMSRFVTSPTPSLDTPSSGADVAVNSTAPVTSTKVASNPESSTLVVPNNKPSPPGANGAKNRTSGTANSATSPPVQEGFFKAITKRLHQVESNLTLSLQYVEDQARHLQESLQRTEHKQISKVNLFLVNLNQTVLAELRTVREQYDQIWQSTVLALESQREQSQREIVALSTRLNVLADEVVFQKRMAIVQAVLLLSCLILVIFSRGVSLPYLAPFTDQGAGIPFGPAASPRARGLYGPAFEAARHNIALYDAREVDYIPVTLASQGLRSQPANRHHSSLSVDEQAALLHCERLSPPPTPSSSDDVPLADRPRQPHDTQATSLRCPPSMHQNSVRKPLPALPENPSSP